MSYKNVSGFEKKLIPRIGFWVIVQVEDDLGFFGRVNAFDCEGKVGFRKARQLIAKHEDDFLTIANEGLESPYELSKELDGIMLTSIKRIMYCTDKALRTLMVDAQI
jgi:hypothetical protein